MSKQIKHVHLLGVCGTAMGSLAILLQQRGYKITGSDQGVYPPMSELLKENKIQVKSPYKVANLHPKPDLVIVGNAISRGNIELEEVLNQRLDYTSFAQCIENFFLKGLQNIVITGTHGKTTTTNLTAFLLKDNKIDSGYLIGGKPNNFEVSAQMGRSGIFVIEGDEYDTAYFDKRSKFLHYKPFVLIINNLEFDHADIFEDLDDIKASFKCLVNLVPQNGLIIANGDDKNVRDVVKEAIAKTILFGFKKNNDVYATDIKVAENTTFVMHRGKSSTQVTSPLMGRYNVLNAMAAMVACQNFKLSLKQLNKSLLNFKGVRRRMEQVYNKEVLVLDDFAHHPTAISETLYAARKRFKARRIIALFEPRSNTAVTNVLQKNYLNAFENADVIGIGKIHRIEKIKKENRLNIKALLRHYQSQKKIAFHESNSEKMVAKLSSVIKPDDVILIMSNGSFDGLKEKIMNHLAQHPPT